MTRSNTRSRRARGTIETLPSGALRVKVYAGWDPVTKRRLYLRETVPASPKAEREAEKVLIRLQGQVDQKQSPGTNATLDELISRYFEVANLEASTLRRDQRNYRNHIRPLTGKTRVGTVDAHVLDSFYTELRRCRMHCDGRKRIDHRTRVPHDCDDRCVPHVCKGLAPSTVRRIHFLLSAAFGRAVRWEWITRNPAATASPPAEPKPDPQPPSPGEAARIVNASFEDPDWGAFVWLAINTGCRRGELCALRWRHVDLASGVLTVHRSLDQDGTTIAEKDTKTHQQRRIALDAETVIVLGEHKARCTERAEQLGIALGEEAFVFSLNPGGSTPAKPATVSQRYSRLASRLGISTSLHKLRHFSATELIAAGVDPRTVGGRLGHSGGGTTTLRVYAAWVAESDQRAAESLSTRMPQRPRDVGDPTERAKSNPRSPYEVVASRIRRQILDGTLRIGDPVPTQKQIASGHHVSMGTANRAIDLLKRWGLVDVRRGSRAVVLEPRESSSPSANASIDDPQAAADGAALLRLRLIWRDQQVREFNADGDPNDSTRLRALLVNAARRHGGPDVDIADYELEVRVTGKAEREAFRYAAF